ncbi:MAG: acyl-CoA dehydrogenase family protein [Planctomycetota bacterium]|jgi:alkylation response protein AidB-like acyl-CoA dehydrogenase
MGLLGCNIEGYGCAGLNSVCYGLVCQELERGDAGIRSFVSVQSSLCMYPILTYGSDEQREQWLPQMVRGEVIACFGLTEPDGGSDPGSMKTHAVRDGGDWVLNGSKMWITNGTIADLAVVWANTDDGVRGFLVEKGTPGYTTRDIERKYSLRASVISELYFDNVRVPDENMLPKARGLGGPLSCLTQARFGIAWGAIGAATACFQEVLEYAKVATGAAQRPGRRPLRPGVDGEMEQRAHGARRGPRRPGYAGGKRHQPRVLPHPAHAQPRERRDLRGDGDDSRAHRRPRAHRTLRLLVCGFTAAAAGLCRPWDPSAARRGGTRSRRR